MRAPRWMRTRRGLQATVLVVAAVVFPAIAGAATHQFGTTTPGGSFGCPPPDYKYANKYTLSEYGAVSKITGWMKGNGGTGSQSFRTMIYAADGGGGAPGTLLVTSQPVDVAGTAGEAAVDFPVSPAVALVPGDYWVAQQSGPSTGGSACLSGAGGGPNNFNGDAYGDGPSNPFAASGPVTIDPNQWTLSVTYASDEVAPTVTASAAPAANANGWNSGNVTVTFTCTDNAGGSGVNTVSPPAIVSTEGANQSVSGSCTDKAGNTASVTQSGINIDKTAPTATASAAPAPNAAGWNQTDVTVTFACTDTAGGSGVDTVTPPTVLSSDGAGQSATGTCTDKAGNSASVTKSGINLDKTAPSLTAAASPAANANGWNSTNVTVTFTCTDATSGVASATSPVTFSSQGANQTANGSCTDKAGNSATASKTVSIDKTNPTVAFGSHPATYTVDQTVTFGCTATDALSGVATSTCANVNAPAWSFGAGPHTVSASATDKAGNGGNASTTFTVQVTGGSLCTLTKQFVQGSAKYQALNAKTKATVDAIWTAACTCVNSVTPKLTMSQKNALVTVYKSTVTRAAADGWLTSAQASTLNGLAGAL